MTTNNEAPQWFSDLIDRAAMTGDHELAWRDFNRWAAFTDDELFGIYSIVAGYADRIHPRSPLAIMRLQATAELERREKDAAS